MNRKKANIDWYKHLEGTPYKTPHEYITAVYAEEKSIKRVSEKTGVCNKTVWYWLHHTKWADKGGVQNRIEALRDRIPTMTMQEIAAETGASVSHVHNVCRSIGVLASNMREATGDTRESQSDYTYQMAGELNGLKCTLCGVELRGNWKRVCPLCKAARSYLSRGLDSSDYSVSFWR